jgi:hypothetical protein
MWSNAILISDLACKITISRRVICLLITTLGKGFHTQVDVGRYLAGDYGATVAVDREFGNGWRVGAYVTKTNLSSERFGEGSFDKGIKITLPMSWALGNSTQKSTETVIQSLTRDGGARVNVNGRLYNTVRETHRAEMAKDVGEGSGDDFIFEIGRTRRRHGPLHSLPAETT